MKQFLAVGMIVACLAMSAGAQDMAVWGIQPPNTPADLTNSAVGPNVLADSGVYAATSVLHGVHASANADWTTPAGNGSSDSYSVNEWAIGDYFQFSTSTTGYTGLEVLWDQTRSSTGPGTFDLMVSTDDINYSVLVDDYVVLENNAANGGAWSAVNPRVPNYQLGPYALPASLENQANVYFRLVNQVTPGGTAGTGRVDNVIVRVVPEPATVGLLALGAVLALRRRR